nr:hypothetical protein [Woeseiaceae bacterium]
DKPPPVEDPFADDGDKPPPVEDPFADDGDKPPPVEDPFADDGDKPPVEDPFADDGDKPPPDTSEDGPTDDPGGRPDGEDSGGSDSDGTGPGDGSPPASAGAGVAGMRAELRDLHEQMAEAADEIEKQRAAFEHQLQKFDYDHTLCDGLHYVQEAWKSMTLAMSAAKKVATASAEVAGKWLTETGVGDLTGAAIDGVGGSSPEAAAARRQVVANAKSASTRSLSRFKLAENALKGLTSYGLERLFRLVCEKYYGPIKGTMTAEVFVDEGRFFAYETRIEGELRLRYQRGSRGEQPVTGEIEGVATGFRLDEDLWRIQPEIKRDVLLRFPYHPVPSLYASSAGTFARVLLSPNYFYIPVRGVINGDRIQIRLLDARQDFEKSSTAVYVLANPSVPFPYVMLQEISHEGAHYILTRALQDDPEFDIVVHRDEEYSEFTEPFQHDAATPDNLVKVRTQVEVRACNPECP